MKRWYCSRSAVPTTRLFAAWKNSNGNCLATARENRIKELKYDFDGDRFNLRDFWATEAALLTVMLAYALMSLFRQGVLRSDAISGKPNVQHTLKTLCYKLFIKVGYITKDGRKKNYQLSSCHAST